MISNTASYKSVSNLTATHAVQLDSVSHAQRHPGPHTGMMNKLCTSGEDIFAISSLKAEKKAPVWVFSFARLA